MFVVCEARMEFKASCRQGNMAARIGSVSLKAVPPKDLQNIVTFCDKLVDIGGAFLETQLLFFIFPLRFYFKLCTVVIYLILFCIH